VTTARATNAQQTACAIVANGNIETLSTQATSITTTTRDLSAARDAALPQCTELTPTV
jgi:hypothetical protein